MFHPDPGLIYKFIMMHGHLNVKLNRKIVLKQEAFAFHNFLTNINHAFLINRNCLGHPGEGSGCILYVFYLLTTESSDWL
jgi:hypothetical protein